MKWGNDVPNKLTSLQEAVALVGDGNVLAFGGNTLNRAPMAFARELARRGVKNLRFIKTAAAHDIDLLCAAGCVATVDAGFISYETQYGLANHYRRAVEQGVVKANEHACYTVMCALRAAISGAPFMPVRGLVVSDLLRENPAFSVVEDPFGTGPVAVVRAMRPDVAVIHVHKCDSRGNAIIEGPRYEDELLVRAAKTVIVTTEAVVADSSSEISAKTVQIPGFLVHSVVHLPGGAKPAACYQQYDPDEKVLQAFSQAKTPEALEAYLNSYLKQDHSSGHKGGWGYATR